MTAATRVVPGLSEGPLSRKRSTTFQNSIRKVGCQLPRGWKESKAGLLAGDARTVCHRGALRPACRSGSSSLSSLLVPALPAMGSFDVAKISWCRFRNIERAAPKLVRQDGDGRVAWNEGSIHWQTGTKASYEWQKKASGNRRLFSSVRLLPGQWSAKLRNGNIRPTLEGGAYFLVPFHFPFHPPSLPCDQAHSLASLVSSMVQGVPSVLVMSYRTARYGQSWKSRHNV